MIILVLFSLQIDHIVGAEGANIYSAYEHSIPYIMITVIDTHINQKFKHWLENKEVASIDTSAENIRFVIKRENRGLIDAMFSEMGTLKFYPPFIIIVGNMDTNFLAAQTFYKGEAKDKEKRSRSEKTYLSIEYTSIKEKISEIDIDAPLPSINSEEYLPLISGLKWMEYKRFAITGRYGMLGIKILPTIGKVRLNILCDAGRERRLWKRISAFVNDTENFSEAGKIKDKVYGEFSSIFTSLQGISDIITLSDFQCADPGLFYQNIKMYLNAITPKDVKNSVSKFIQEKRGWNIHIKGDLDIVNEQFFIGDK